MKDDECPEGFPLTMLYLHVTRTVDACDTHLLRSNDNEICLVLLRKQIEWETQIIIIIIGIIGESLEIVKCCYLLPSTKDVSRVVVDALRRPAGKLTPIFSNLFLRSRPPFFDFALKEMKKQKSNS